MYFEPLADAVLGPCTIGGPTGTSVFCPSWFVWALNGAMLLTLFGCYLYKNECERACGTREHARTRTACSLVLLADTCGRVRVLYRARRSAQLSFHDRLHPDRGCDRGHHLQRLPRRGVREWRSPFCTPSLTPLTFPHTLRAAPPLVSPPRAPLFVSLCRHRHPLACRYEDLILQALLFTSFIFGCLTLWTMQSRIRFDFLIVPLTLSLLLLIFAGVIARVFNSPFLYTVYAYSGSLVFMGYARAHICFCCHRNTSRLLVLLRPPPLPRLTTPPPHPLYPTHTSLPPSSSNNTRSYIVFDTYMITQVCGTS